MKNATRSQVWRPLLLAAAAALCSAGPAQAASCPVTVTDADRNGNSDLDIKGLTGRNKLILNIGQISSTLSLDSDGDGGFAHPTQGDLKNVVFPAAQTYLIHLNGNDDITVCLSGDLTGVTKNLAIPLGAGVNSVKIGGPSCTTNG